jgi:scyllo-inositol 2-dehydrogenase (NAD+)
MSKLAVGVVGMGRMGRHHAENLRWRIPEAKLVAVADPDPETARRHASELGIEHSYNTLDALVERKDIDAVVIASPSRFHSSAVQTAASAGKHVFCEKPPALTVEDVDAAIAAVGRAGVLFQVALMRRFDPPYVAAQKRIEAGEIGTPIMFRSISRDQDPPPLSFYQAGNGPLFVDMGIHDFDAARWLMMDEVAEVHAFGGTLASPEPARFGDIDAGMVNLRFSRAGIGNVEVFRQARYGYDIFTEVVGTEATLRIGYLRRTALTILKREGIAHDAVDHFLVRFAEAYLNELRAFVHSVLAGSPSRVSGADARKALVIALAADRSRRDSQPVLLSPQARSRTTGAAE